MAGDHGIDEQVQFFPGHDVFEGRQHQWRGRGIAAQFRQDPGIEIVQGEMDRGDAPADQAVHELGVGQHETVGGQDHIPETGVPYLLQDGEEVLPDRGFTPHERGPLNAVGGHPADHVGQVGCRGVIAGRSIKATIGARQVADVTHIQVEGRRDPVGQPLDGFHGVSEGKHRGPYREVHLAFRFFWMIAHGPRMVSTAS